ncbi:DUF3800 domain-containing protein [Bacillus cereus]|nr:DUF3800 domain-containing protein [Bacillus cereus]
MNYDIYCDESGNSGGNYLDPQQPFYILAGWFVERNLKYRAENRVIAFKKEHFPDKEELKGAEILKSNHGQILGNKLLSELGKGNCIPFFVIAEKRYCLSAKMVEAFLDPVHNEKVSTAFSWMNGIKKDIAQIIYNVSDQSLKKFANAHKYPSIEALMDAQQTLIDELNQNGYTDIANAIDGSTKYMDLILEEETYAIDALPNKALRALNLPVFTDFIQIVERFTRNHNIKKVRMFHDETKQFREAYPEAFSWYARAKKEHVELVLENGNTILSSFKSLQVFGMQESKGSMLIQGADILASFINLYCTRIMKNKKISPELKKLGELLLGALLVNDKFEGHGFTDLISSTNFKHQLATSIGLQPKPIDNTHLEKLKLEPYIKI